MTNALIITGGNLNLKWAESILKRIQYDYVIAADSGLKYADELGVKPDAILGDYDSLEESVLEKYKDNNVECYPREKDYTDTHLAINKAIDGGAKNITILGAIGTRMDHTMNNIGLLKMCLELNVKCVILDEHNKIQLLNDKSEIMTIKKDEQYGKFVTIIPMSEVVELTLEGFKYNLTNYQLKQGLSICQSNEIKEDECSIKVSQGTAFILETND